MLAYKAHKLADKELRMLEKNWATIIGQKEQISREFPTASAQNARQIPLEQMQELMQMQAENDMDESLDRIKGVIQVINGRETETAMGLSDDQVLQSIQDEIHAVDIGCLVAGRVAIVTGAAAA